MIFATFSRALAGFVVCAVFATAASAGQPKLVEIPHGTLMRVDEGVFRIEIGKSIDLTDRKVLLNIKYVNKRDEIKCCNISLNGQSVQWAIGSRIDLKRERQTRDYFKDRNDCFLDIIDVLTPKGATGTATFRLHCI